MTTIPRGRQRPSTVDTTDTVELRVPADPAYLAVIRTATAGLAARLNLTLDDIEDLRIAVDEACSLLLQGRAHPGDNLDAIYTIADQTMSVLITGPAEQLPTDASFSWTVLRALAGEVNTGLTSSGAWIELTHLGRGEQ